MGENSSDEELIFQEIPAELSVAKANDLFSNLSTDSYDVFTTLGTGTFGKVKQIILKNDPSRCVYALKIMKKHDIIRLKQVDHIKSEKNILMDISHPFFVQLKGYF